MSSGKSEVNKIKLGGREFVLHEFPWGDLKKFLPKLSSISQIDFTKFSEDDLDKIADVMFGAISQPDLDGGGGAPIKRDEFEKLPITLKQMMDAIPHVLKQTGSEPTKTGEA